MEDFICKREICRQEIAKGHWKKALKLAKGFDKIFNRDQMRNISIAYEILSGKESFYQGLKIDTHKVLEDAKEDLAQYLKNFNDKKK